MSTTISVRIDDELDSQLEQSARRTGRAKSEFIREAIKRQLAIDSFQNIRTKILPFAESQGILTDEDIWEQIS